MADDGSRAHGNDTARARPAWTSTSQIKDVTGWPSGCGHHLVDIKLRILPQYCLHIAQLLTPSQQNVTHDQMDHPVFINRSIRIEMKSSMPCVEDQTDRQTPRVSHPPRRRRARAHDAELPHSPDTDEWDCGVDHRVVIVPGHLIVPGDLIVPWDLKTKDSDDFVPITATSDLGAPFTFPPPRAAENEFTLVDMLACKLQGQEVSRNRFGGTSVKPGSRQIFGSSSGLENKRRSEMGETVHTNLPG